MIGRPEYTLTLPPPCPTNRDHLRPHTSLYGLTPMDFATRSAPDHKGIPLTYG